MKLPDIHFCWLYKEAIDHFVRIVEWYGKMRTEAVIVYRCSKCHKTWEEVS